MASETAVSAIDFMGLGPLLAARGSRAASLEAQPVHQIVERRPADAEQLGSLDDIAIGSPERRNDGALLGRVARRAQVELILIRRRRLPTVDPGRHW